MRAEPSTQNLHVVLLLHSQQVSAKATPLFPGSLHFGAAQLQKVH